MKIKTLLVVGTASIIGIAIMAGCSSTTTTYYAADGKTVTKVEEKSDDPLHEKDLAVGGAVTAVKVETTGSTSSGTLLPNFLIGGGATGMAASPKTSTRPVVNCSRSAGVLSSLTNSSAYSGSINYIGVPGETAAETKSRLLAIQQFQAGTLSDSTSTDTSSSTTATTSSTSATTATTSSTAATTSSSSSN